MRDSLYFYFDGLEHSLCLTGCSYLADDFPTLFFNQDYHEGEHDDNPLISIQLDNDEYHLSTSWLDKTVSYTDKVDVLCDLVAKLAVARSFTDLETLYLHAAGVVINGRAVVFPSQYRAGKSFLTACLVAEGQSYLGDDVVPLVLDTCKAHTAGFAPRLRLPLPATTDDKSRHFIENHTAMAGKRYAYLDMAEEVRLAQTDPRDIGAFVLLERQEGIAARLEELPVATVFQQLIKQNFAREIDGGRILGTLTQAVSNAQCMKLLYDRADEAVRLLSDHFSSWPDRTELSQPGHGIAASGANTTAIVPGGSLVQNKQVQKIRIEGENFLTSPDGKAIYHLNPIGSGIWELLAEPTSKQEILSILETAFPETEKSIIDKDVTKILKRFQSKNLVRY